MVEKYFLRWQNPFVEQIVDSIVNAIIEGELKPGDKIPTETELCNSMNVGKNLLEKLLKF